MITAHRAFTLLFLVAIAATATGHTATVTAQEPPAATSVSSTPAFPAEAEPSWHISSGQAVITWPKAQGATSYRLSQTPYGSATCATGHCKVTAETPLTTHRMTVPPSREPGSSVFFWISACDDLTCSKPKRVPFQEKRPPAPPANLHATATNGQISLSWEPTGGATSYTLLHSDTSPHCSLTPSGKPTPCAAIATGIIENSHLHRTPSPDRNRYWITACNDAGCTPPTGPGTTPRNQPEITEKDKANANTASSPTAAEPANPTATLSVSPSTIYTGQTLYATINITNEDSQLLPVILTVESPHGWSAVHRQHESTCSPAGCRLERILQPGQTATLNTPLSPSEPGHALIRATASTGDRQAIQELSAPANVLRAQPLPHAAQAATTSAQPASGTTKMLITTAALAAASLLSAALYPVLSRTKRRR